MAEESKKSTFIGENRDIDPEPLEKMRKSGGSWYAYQNHDLASGLVGSLLFMKCGPGCNVAEPPHQYPDGTSVGPGWRWRLVGRVDLGDGKVLDL